MAASLCHLLCRLLDDNRELYVPELREAVRPHPHFMLFATQNPAGGAYAGDLPSRVQSSLLWSEVSEPKPFWCWGAQCAKALVLGAYDPDQLSVSSTYKIN